MIKTNIALLTFFVCFYLPCIGQDIEWWKEGSEWIFTKRVISQGISRDTFVVKTDTLIDNKSCSIIANKNNDFRQILFYDEGNDQVFRHQEGGFRLLYDFSASVGDTLNIWIPYSPRIEGDSSTQVVIDSIGTVFWQGQELRWYSCRSAFPIPLDQWDFGGTVVEKIGHLTVREPLDALLDAILFLPLLEYKDPSGVWVRLDTAKENCSPVEWKSVCEYSPVVNVSVNKFLKENISVRPNPALDYLLISSKHLEMKRVKIYDFKGRLVLKHENLFRESDIRISLPSSLIGLYLLEVESSRGSFVKKVVLSNKN